MSGNDIVTNLTICPGDVDTFQVEVGPDSILEVFLAYTAANGNLSLTLLDIDGSSPLLFEDTQGNDEFISITGLAPGVYYMLVSGEQNTYDLLTNSRPIEDTNCTDAFEPNEVADTSPVLSPGNYEGLKICSGDVDFFAVSVAPGDVLEASVLFSHLDGDIDLALLDINQTVLGRSVSISDNESISFNRFTRAGNVFLRVEGFEDEANEYVLDIVVRAADNSCEPDEAEPNDTANQATRLVDGESRSLTVCPNEQDFFSIALDEGERIEATIEFVHAEADLDLALFAPDAQDSLIISAGISDSETVRWTALEGGNHFINAFGFEGDSGSYTISVRTCENDADDPNDTPAEAASLSSGVREQKLCLAEEDWYVIEFQSGQLALFEIGLEGGTGVEAQLFAANGIDLIAPFENDNGGLQSLHQASQDETILLRVLSRDFQSLVTNYTLSVEIE
jgi:hypothetical protein